MLLIVAYIPAAEKANRSEIATSQAVIADDKWAVWNPNIGSVRFVCHAETILEFAIVETYTIEQIAPKLCRAELQSVLPEAVYNGLEVEDFESLGAAVRTLFARWL